MSQTVPKNECPGTIVPWYLIFSAYSVQTLGEQTQVVTARLVPGTETSAGWLAALIPNWILPSNESELSPESCQSLSFPVHRSCVPAGS